MSVELRVCCLRAPLALRRIRLFASAAPPLGAHSTLFLPTSPRRWYSGCPVCSGSRTALMTGRQYTRVGCPGVFGDSSTTGLPLNETTVADQLKKAKYATAVMGK